MAIRFVNISLDVYNSTMLYLYAFQIGVHRYNCRHGDYMTSAVDNEHGCALTDMELGILY